VNLDHFHKNIESAKAVAAFAKSATDSSGPAVGRDLQSVPVCLGHLSVPNAENDLNSTKSSVGACKNLQETTQELVHLPGSVEAFENDTSQADATFPWELPAGAKALSLSASQCNSQPMSPVAARELSANNGHGKAPEASIDEVASSKDGRGPGEETGTQQISRMSSDFGSSEDDDTNESSDGWPPKPPLLRFKMRVQFSQRFKPSKDKAIFAKMNEDLNDRMVEKVSKGMQDMVVGWINQYFAFDIKTEFQFEICFPIIVLTMLDAIYPKRVRWREVDWRFQYKHALTKNHNVLQAVWMEVNMDKAREFRVENTALRIETMLHAPISEKLEFLRILKRWFEHRINSAEHYDPQQKRHEYVQQCKAWGYEVKFPPWILYDKDRPAKVQTPQENEDFNKMPEYKRLIWFLGSTEHQTM